METFIKEVSVQEGWPLPGSWQVGSGSVRGSPVQSGSLAASLQSPTQVFPE